MRLTFAYLELFGKKHGVKIERRGAVCYDVWDDDANIAECHGLLEAYEEMIDLIRQKEEGKQNEFLEIL